MVLPASLTCSPACLVPPATRSPWPSASILRLPVARPTSCLVRPLPICSLFFSLSIAPMGGPCPRSDFICVITRVVLPLGNDCPTANRSGGVAGGGGAGGVAVLGPGAGVQAAAAETGVLDHQQVVAGGDAGAAVGDERGGVGDAGLGQLLAELPDRQEPALGAQGLAAGGGG